MKIRREKGVFLIIGLILFCVLFFLIFPKDRMDGDNTVVLQSNGDQIDRSNASEDAVTPKKTEKDISGETIEEDPGEKEYNIAQRMGLLSYERRGNQKMIFLFSSILICYLIVIGPLSYVYVKYINQMEKIWVIIPLEALFFGCLVLFLADSFTVQQPQLDVLTVECPEEQTEVYVSVTSAGKKNSRIFFHDLVDTIDYFYIEGRYDLMADEKGIVIQPEYAFEKDYLHLLLEQTSGSFVAFEEQSLSGSKKENNFLLQNETGYDFSYVLICQGEKYALLSDVKQGEQIQIPEEKWISGKDRRRNEQNEVFRTKMTKNEEKLLRYALEEYEKSDKEKGYLAALHSDGEDGITEQGLDILSYGLYYQDLNLEQQERDDASFGKY